MTATQKKELIQCSKCGEDMELMTAKKHTGKSPLVLMAGGIFCILFIGGALLGIPLLLLGIYQFTAKQIINYCPGCGYHYKAWKPEID